MSDDLEILIVTYPYAGIGMGRDNGGVVDLDYESKAPYAFTGTVRNAIFDLAPMDHTDALALHAHDAGLAVGGAAAC